MLATLSSPFLSPLLPNPNPRRTRNLSFTTRRSRIFASIPDSTENSKVEYMPWLIVGLENPDNKYHGTRHNLGFEMVDRILQEEGILLNTNQSKILFGIDLDGKIRQSVGSVGKVPVLLAKPQSYMGADHLLHITKYLCNISY